MTKELKIREKIYIVRKINVMLDSDLAELYDVDTKVLNQAVRRNISRFPEDFMFQLNKDEYEKLRSQIVTAKSLSMRRNLPYVFTEHGILMLSSVLNSEKAIQVNIKIMRTFNHMRKLLSSQVLLSQKLEKIEKQEIKNTKNIEKIWLAIKELYGYKERSEKRKIGFDSDKEDK
ncbi:MAG: ORF6N domain-containing protein [Spirochaetia bacterium]|nr:ORF6N domain-containing protein [Spirochaetia bacterium]